ncbi:MAG: hypothetical protein UT24_C0005G0063 [Candidatus Woesebacteria bacterium GW2011_GWB1_39_12]|uniref:VIT family protein n=2 Tax=Candidatus Woeseibacteriota TaxID=1752722 RepID=A0A0G0PIW6_9BACT|nr:MAG: hypothetical protein UT23_C0006G0085 [Candidatus Woesebacteria bacterium GW2011_GWA1_39_12]KKR01354.1 MAG: hypothetical protein UT24_C0005G0063 [Candidatus Woesebacteria bacterium GW2011_GWB1_39_12]
MLEKVLHARGSYLRDAVFSASDGVITTFAVVAGSTGAALGANVVIILGFANLLADGFSMASGTYLGVKSEIEFEKAEGDKHASEASPFKQGLVTFLSFNFAGLIPLFPYILNIRPRFYTSLFLVFFAMFVIGAIKGKYTRKSRVRSGVEMLLIGGFAAFVAYGVGFLIDRYMI